MENTTFNTGDTVQVKGIMSPRMKIITQAHTSVTGPIYLCGWFDFEYSWREELFNCLLLEAYKPFEDVKVWLRALPIQENDE